MKSKKEKGERLIFAPCSVKQQSILLDDSTDILLCGGGAGGGKALRHGEGVLTPNGFVPVESICVGDVVMSPNGGTQTVVATLPQGEVEVFRVTFQDGRTVDTCGEHLWQYHVSRKGLQSTRVGDTRSMARLLESTSSSPIVPLTQPVEFPKEDLQLHPYVLGAILGDGWISEDGICQLTSADKEIPERIQALGIELSRGYAKQGTDASTYNIKGVRKVLRDLGVAGKKSQEKFIPSHYKQSTVADRLDLVRGLMDTDGYVSKDGKTYFDTTSKTLAEDLTTVLQSLGYSATQTVSDGRYRKDGAVVECSPVYSLYIRGSNQRQLFSLARKVDRCKDKQVGLRVTSVKSIGKDFATCISVSSDDALFLTTGYVVTHNSHTCLTKALKYINDPAARVLIVRRTYPMLKISGGLWDESKKIYRHFGGIPKIQKLTWEFPNGATIQFAAIPDDLSEWQGLQATNILVDESAEFTQEEILFLASRLRGADYKGHLNVTMTCNPSRDSFLYTWVQYSLDDTTGVPHEGTENIVRYFINVGGKLYWSSVSKDDLWEKYGQPMGLVRESDDPKKINFLPMSFRFIPLTIYDNPILLKNNPQYLANLLSQPRVNQLRYLHGSWTARAEGSGFFRREWVEFVDHPPAQTTSRVRSWDLAASIPSESNPNPDWTAGVKMSRDRFGYYYVEDVNRFRKLSDGVIKEIITTAVDDGLDDTKVTIPKDPGAGGKTANSFQLRTMAEAGITATSVVVSGHSGKISRFTPFCTLAESGYVRVVRGDWNEEWLTELECFEGLRTQKDDQVDATADAFNTLSKTVVLPTFALPSLEQKSPIPTIPS